MEVASWVSVSPMSRTSFLPVLICGALVATAASASAQQTSGDTPSQADTPSMVIASPQPSSSQAWLERELDDAETRVRRTRNALIGTSVGFAVGIVLAGAAASQCESFTNIQGNEDIRCNSAGEALIATGATISGLSIIGMITSGAMLGVAKRNKRELEREIRRGYYGGRLQWDAAKGALTF